LVTLSSIREKRMQCGGEIINRLRQKNVGGLKKNNEGGIMDDRRGNPQDHKRGETRTAKKAVKQTKPTTSFNTTSFSEGPPEAMTGERRGWKLFVIYQR